MSSSFTLIYLITSLVVNQRNNINITKDKTVVESIYSKNKYSNPIPLYSNVFKDISKQEKEIPNSVENLLEDLNLTDKVSLGIFGRENLIKPIAEMANYFYSFVNHKNESSIVIRDLIELMLLKGNRPVLHTETFPFWSYYDHIFKNTSFVNKSDIQESVLQELRSHQFPLK